MVATGFGEEILEGGDKPLKNPKGERKQNYQQNTCKKYTEKVQEKYQKERKNIRYKHPDNG